VGSDEASILLSVRWLREVKCGMSVALKDYPQYVHFAADIEEIKVWCALKPCDNPYDFRTDWDSLADLNVVVPEHWTNYHSAAGAA
jgi:hypothetical protein